MKISVITGTFNSVETLREALESLVRQTYCDIEYIVIDGGSTDGTLALLGEYSQYITVIRHDIRGGVYAALNEGIRAASGDVVGVLHSDDIFETSSVLGKVAETFSVDDIDLVYGDLVYVDRSDVEKTKRVWKAGAFSKSKLRYGWMPPHPACFIRRARLYEVGLYDERFKISSDYDLLMKIMQLPDVQISYLPSVLVRMRVGGLSNRSMASYLVKLKEDYFICRKNEGGVLTVGAKIIRKLPQFLIED